MIEPPYTPEPFPQQSHEQPASIDLTRLLRRLIRGLPIVLVVCLLSTAASYYLFKHLPEKFSSTVSILIDPKQPGSLGADTAFGSGFVDNSKVSSVEIVLQSSNLLRQVAEKLHLADDPYYGALPPSRLASLKQWITGNKAAPVSETQEEREDHAVARLWQMTNPARIGATYVIKLDVTAPKPRDAAEIAGAVADIYIQGLVDAKQDAARQDALWLSDRMNTQRNDLLKSETAVAAIRQKFGLVGSDAKDDASVDRQSVGAVNQQMVGVDGDIANIEARWAAADAVRRNGGNLLALPDVESSPVIQQLQAKQADAQQRLATLSARYYADYPLVKQAAREADAINAAIASAAQRIVEGLHTQYVTTVAHKNALTNEMNHLVGKVNETARAEGRIELREAERIAQANQVAYEASLNKLREVELQGSRVGLEARIISGPSLTDTPTFPRAIQFLPAGAFMGILLGLGLVFVLPLGTAKIETASEVERDLSLQMLGSVPYLTEARLTNKDHVISIPDYLVSHPYSVFAESLRLLRYRLLGLLGPTGRVLQVTSSIPGEGKSTIAASLAISAATGHLRTVLVDLDLHRPGASRLLGSDSNSGVIDYLLGNATSDNAVKPHKKLPITVVDAGSYDTLHPGLIESQKLKELIARLRQEYDLVIVDSPPILAVTDAVFVARLVEATLLVVAWRDTPRDLVLKSVEILRATVATPTGVLLNKVSESSALAYGSHKYGYYSAVAQTEKSRV